MLTGGAIADNPDPLTHGEGYPNPGTAACVLTVAELYRQTKLGNESQIAKRHLLALGVPDTAILMDDTSRNTEENAVHSWKRPVLITLAYHIARAVKYFQKLKANVLPYPTDYQTSIRQDRYVSKFIPSAVWLSATTTALKEVLGIFSIRAS